MKALLILLWMSWGIYASPACPDFTKGVNLYEQKQFQAATSVWENCLQQGVRSTDLYFNLGNAEYRQGNLGRAIWNYRLANLLHPNDADVEANLKFATARIVDKVETPESENPVFAALWKLHNALSLNQELIGLVLLAWLLLKLILGQALPIPHRAKTMFRLALFGFSIFTAILTLHVVYKAYTLESNTQAVVLSHSADVMSGPGDQYQVLNELHEGTTVQVLEVQDAWVSIQLGEQVKGFVSLAELGMVR